MSTDASVPTVPLLPEPICRIDDCFCGCGDPDSAWEEILAHLRSATRFDRDSIEERLDIYGIGARMIVAYLLDHLRLTEHGGSVGGAWLTDAGREALAFLESEGIDWHEREWIDAEGVTRGTVGG